MSDTVGKDLKNWFADAQKVVVAGIGNPIRSDDYVGLKIVKALQGKVPETVCLLECETVPESYILDIEQFQPTHVLLIDAAFLELKPGDAQLVDAERMMDYSAVSTHALPLRIFCEHVQKVTGAKIGLLLIEPADMEFGEGLSVEVEAASELLTKVLLEQLVQKPLFFSKRSWR
jgi:hydrogenase 3 maturation protease